MKVLIIVAFIILVAALSFVFIPNGRSYATDNTTVGIGFSQNITIGDITVGPSEALVTLIDNAVDGVVQGYENSMSNLVSALKFGAGVFLVLGMLVIALWRQKVFLHAVAGIVAFFIGITWVSDNPGVSYAVCFIGAFELLSALLLALESDQPAQGMSRFRGMVNKVKEWF